MKKFFLILTSGFLAFTFFIVPVSASENSLVYDDLPQWIKDKYKPTEDFWYGKGINEDFITTGTSNFNSNNIIRGYWSSGYPRDFGVDEVEFYYSTFDIKTADGVIVFQKPQTLQETTEKAIVGLAKDLSQVFLTVLKTGLVVFSALLLLILLVRFLNSVIY